MDTASLVRRLFGQRSPVSHMRRRPRARITLEVEEVEQRILCAADKIWEPENGPGILSWGIAKNWDPEGVPDFTTTVEIPAGSDPCTVDGNRTALSVTVHGTLIVSVGNSLTATSLGNDATLLCPAILHRQP